MKKNENIKNIIKEQASFFSFEGELSVYEDYNLNINYKTNDSINDYQVYIYNEAFVNILLLIGIEKFNINLNEPVNTFINEFKNKEITLLNVLKDDTGLVDVYGVLANRYRLNDEYINLSDEDKMIYDINFNYSLISKKIIFDILNANVLQHNPGATHDGSNIAKVLGVILIEKIFKKPYLELLDEHLLTPLNITLDKTSQEFYRYRNDYPNVKKAFLVKDFSLFINLSLNDVYKIYKALKTGQLINKLYFEKMKELTPYSGICFYKTFAFVNHFRLAQFDIWDFKHENRIIIKSQIFKGFEKNINGDNKYFDDYILSRIVPYYLKYNNPKLVRLSSDTIYDLLDIENDPSQMWFMGSTKYILAYEYIEPTVYNYVLVDNEIVVGTIILTIDKENNEYTISDVLIDMKYQGRGYGKALIKEALKELRKHGAKKISMGVEKINDRAVKTYLGAGFKIVETHVRSYWIEYIYED